MSANPSATPTLATRLLGESASQLPVQIGLAVAGSIALAISSKFMVPVGPVPFTLQTLVLLVIAASYGRNLALATVVLYLAQGAIGLPVFTAPGALFGPTGGFLLGFIPVAAIVGEAADRGLARSPLAMGGAMLIGEAILFAMGFAWFATLFPLDIALDRGFGSTWSFGWAVAVQPFIIPDLVKIAIAALVVAGASATVRH